jgi:hypothetical protein
MPQCIVVDEIGTQAEADAARTIAQRGVQLIATAHGHTLANVVKNPSLVGLVGGIESVTLGDEEARRRGVTKSVLERQGPPTFNICVEMLAIGRWRVHLDVATAVDALLAGREPQTELRCCARDGSVTIAAEGDASAAAAGDAAGNAAPPLADSSAAKPTRAAAAAAPAGPPAVRLFCNGIDTEALARVVAALGMQRAVVLTASLEDADAILALRARLGRAGADDWLRLTARARGLPLYAIKTDTLAQLVRALKTITGAPTTAAAEEAALSRDASESGSERSSAAAFTPASAVDAADALEEARLAVEQIVIPRGTPVELLPRAPHVRQQQQALVASYRLATATAGEGAAARLRILPEYTAAPPRAPDA